MPTVVKNLLIINGLFFLAKYSIQTTYGIEISSWLGLYFPLSEKFLPFQFITHMFMHGDFGHIFSNMLMLWFLGSAMENFWGPKRFLIYYMLTGLGASALQIGVNAIEYYQLSADPSYLNQRAIDSLLDTPMIGASGAVFGVLLAFGMTFPNQLIYLNFLFPVKAKYFVIGYGFLELYNGFRLYDSDIAHFAHLGGMLFGYILIRKWRRERYK